MRPLHALPFALSLVTVGCAVETHEPTTPPGIRETGYLRCTPAPEACGPAAVQCFGPDGAADCVDTPACEAAATCACAGALCGAQQACFDDPAGGFRCGPPAVDAGPPDAGGGPDARPDRGVTRDAQPAPVDGHLPDAEIVDVRDAEVVSDAEPVDAALTDCPAAADRPACVMLGLDCAWDGARCRDVTEASPLRMEPSFLVFDARAPGTTTSLQASLRNPGDVPIPAPWLRLDGPPSPLQFTLAATRDDPDVPSLLLEGDGVALGGALDGDIAPGETLTLTLSVAGEAEAGQHTLWIGSDADLTRAYGVLPVITR